MRSAAAPDVPTLMEQGVERLRPGRLVHALCARGHAAGGARRSCATRAPQALAQPELMARLREQGIEQRPMRGDEMAPFNRVELGKWAELVKRSGAQVD